MIPSLSLLIFDLFERKLHSALKIHNTLPIQTTILSRNYLRCLYGICYVISYLELIIFKIRVTAVVTIGSQYSFQVLNLSMSAFISFHHEYRSQHLSQYLSKFCVPLLGHSHTMNLSFSGTKIDACRVEQETFTVFLVNPSLVKLVL